jgi:glycosyltransferase involved in cell wall biosynthesis
MGSELLRDRVRFIRPTKNIEEYLQASDVFLLNSKQEGVPNSLLEAMSCGVVPVIRTLAGVSDYLIFHDKNAMEYQDVSQMLKCIESLFMDIEKRKNLSVNARETILKNAAYEITMDRLFEKISGS